MTFKLIPLREVDLPMATQFIEESAEWCPVTPNGVNAGAILAAENAHWRAATTGGDLVGIIGFTNISWLDKVADVCLGVVPKLRGRGLAKTLARQQNTYAFDILGLERLQMFALEGAPSCRIAQAVGLRLEGTLRGLRLKDGLRRNASIYGLLKEK